MKQPKYNIGDRVWLMFDNQVKEEMVTGVLGIIDSSQGEDGINVLELVGFRYITMWSATELNPYEEQWLYETKQDLINSL